MEVITARNCRICLSQCENRDLDISEFAVKYLTCTGFQITESDIPKKICSTCTSELISTSNFLVKCEETEVILENLRPEMLSEEGETLEMSCETFEEVLSQMKQEVVQEKMNDAGDASLDHHKSVVKSETPSNDDHEEYETLIRLTCDYCEYEIHTEKKIIELKNHVQKCHKDIEMKNCTQCSMRFPLQTLLYLHTKECHREDTIKDHITCTFCNAHSHKADVIHRHVASHHKNEELFTCIICQKGFRTMDDLRLHIKQTFCGSNILSDTEINFEYEIKCDFCGFKCALEANMKYHVEKMHSNEKLLQCACEANIIYCKDLINERLKYKCNSDRPCQDRDKTMSIQRLPKLSQDIDGLTPTQRRKLRQKETVECEFCHEKIKRASLQRHIKNLHKGIKYFCEYCEKSYTLLQTLKTHIIKHHMNQKLEYPCRYCNRVFNTWASRYYHQIRIHTKDFKFKCDTCGKQFIHQTDYEDHNSIHTGAKVRACDKCPEMFTTRNSLCVHKEKVHGKEFTEEKELKKHVKEGSMVDTIVKMEDVYNETTMDEYAEAERIFEQYLQGQ